MASTRASAGASAANAPSRRQPTPRSAPATPAPKKRWSPKEEAQLTKMYKSKGPVWAELAQRLGTGRTIKQVEAKVTALGLRQREKRAAGGPTWHAQGRRLGDKNKKRKEAAKAALTLASPAGVPPSEPLPKRPAAAAADAAMLAELEGHGNFGALLEPLGEDSGQINAVRGFFIPYKPIRSSLHRIRGNPKNHVSEPNKHTVRMYTVYIDPRE